MANTSNLLYTLYNFNGEDLVSISFKYQQIADGYDDKGNVKYHQFVVVHFEKNRQSYRQDMRLDLTAALQLHGRLEAGGCRRGMMVYPVMADVDKVVSVFDDEGGLV